MNIAGSNSRSSKFRQYVGRYRDLVLMWPYLLFITIPLSRNGYQPVARSAIYAILGIVLAKRRLLFAFTFLILLGAINILGVANSESGVRLWILVVVGLVLLFLFRLKGYLKSASGLAIEKPGLPEVAMGLASLLCSLFLAYRLLGGGEW
jgi:hypothetical protein